MDKKIKKKLEVIRQRLQKLHLQLAGARKQDDTPGEIQRLEDEINKLETEVEELKKS